MTLFLEETAHINIVFSHLFPSFSSLFAAENVELRQRSSCLRRIDARRVDIRVAHVTDEFQESFIFHTDEADVGA